METKLAVLSKYGITKEEWLVKVETTGRPYTDPFFRFKGSTIQQPIDTVLYDSQNEVPGLYKGIVNKLDKMETE